MSATFLGKALRFTVLALACVFFALLTLFYGSADLELSRVVNILTQPQGNSTEHAIVWMLRMPRVVAAVCAGAGLSVSGLLLQTIFRNPLAGPYVLGVSSGAGFGVALVLLAGVGASQWGIMGAATMGASLVLMLVLALARMVRSPTSLLVIGLMVGYLVDALVGVLIHFGEAERLQSYVVWGFGSFGRLQPSQMPILVAIVLLGIILAMVSVRYLNALLLGEDAARSLGIPVRQARLVALGAASLLAAVVTVFCGPIGFLGLAVPHVARAVFRTANHRILVPASALLGSLLALLAGWISQWPGSQLTLPLHAVTSLLGAPVVVWVILSRRARTE